MGRLDAIERALSHVSARLEDYRNVEPQKPRLESISPAPAAGLAEGAAPIVADTKIQLAAEITEVPAEILPPLSQAESPPPEVVPVTETPAESASSAADAVVPNPMPIEALNAAAVAGAESGAAAGAAPTSAKLPKRRGRKPIRCVDRCAACGVRRDDGLGEYQCATAKTVGE
jgi:hypothetical protein